MLPGVRARLVAALALAPAAGAGSTEMSAELATNKIGCRSLQDIVDVLRFGDQAEDDAEKQAVVQALLISKFDDGTC